MRDVRTSLRRGARMSHMVTCRNGEVNVSMKEYVGVRCVNVAITRSAIELVPRE